MPPIAARPEPTGWSLPEPATGWSDPEPERHRERQRWIAATAVATAPTLVIVIGVGWWLWEAREGSDEATLVLEGLSEDSIHEAWAVDLPAPPGESFSREHGTVCVADDAGHTVVSVNDGDSSRLTMLEPDSGKVRWSAELDDEVYGCQVDGALVFCVQESTVGEETQGRVIAFASHDGSEHFRTPWEENLQDFAVVDEALFTLNAPYVSDESDPVRVTSYSRSGTERWRSPGDGRVLDSGYPALRTTDGRIGVEAAQGEDGRHLTFDIETGELAEDRGYGYLVGLPFVGAWSAEDPADEDEYGSEVLAPRDLGPESMGAGAVVPVDGDGEPRRVVLDGFDQYDEDEVRMFSATPDESRELWTESGTYVGACPGGAFVDDDGEIIARSDTEGRLWTTRLGGDFGASSAYCGEDRVLLPGWEGTTDEDSDMAVRMVSRDGGHEVWRAPTRRGDVADADWAVSSTGYTEVYADSDGDLHVRRFEW